MDRQELLRQAAQTYLTPCYQNAASLALAAFTEQQEEILGGLSRRVSGLVETVRQQQERGEKKGAPVSGGFLPVQQHSDTQL